MSTIVFGTIYWPFFSKNPNNFIAIDIGCISFLNLFKFVIVLLLLVLKPIDIGLNLVDIWYCIVIVCLVFYMKKVQIDELSP